MLKSLVTLTRLLEMLSQAQHTFPDHRMVILKALLVLYQGEIGKAGHSVIKVLGTRVDTQGLTSILHRQDQYQQKVVLELMQICQHIGLSICIGERHKITKYGGKNGL